ncbi:spermatogenesis-associated protein 31D1 [Orycteropus afer afer]|uniref:Spermatogenesis-associated protein 31D1 n=1 Tax=Orycteropus afer afer TaxID=1230840 RepID=A0AC54Z9D8_ORYAF|nr:spermatogenesis-associated protein 31D1 [Orycteropus afer afer]
MVPDYEPKFVDKYEFCTSYLYSPLGQHHDTIRFRQMLCPDPLCKVCNRTTAEVGKLLFGEPVEDVYPYVSSVASTVPITESSTLAPSEQPLEDSRPAFLPEPSVPLSSTLSPDLMTPLVDTLSNSPPGDSLSPEPISPLDSTFPVNHFPPQPLALSPFPLHHAQRVDHIPQPDLNLSLNTNSSLDPTLSQDMNFSPYLSDTMDLTDSFTCHYTSPTLSALQPPDHNLTQPKLIAVSQKPVPEGSSPASPGGLAPYMPAGTDMNRSTMNISEFSSWPAHAKDWFPLTLTKCDFNQKLLPFYSSEVSFGGNLATNSVEASNLCLLSPDILALLERQIKKRGDFLKEKEMKKENFTSIIEKHDSAASIPFWDMEGKPNKLHNHQESPYPNTCGDHVNQEHIQLFWGLPSLHSESLMSTILVSAGCSSAFVYFNSISNIRPVQTQDKKPPLLSHPLSLSLPEIQPQTLPESQNLHLTQVQPQANLQSQLLPPSPPQTKGQEEEQPLTQDEIHHLEWHVLQKQVEGLWGIPSVVQNSQEAFCPSAPKFPQHNRPYLAQPPKPIIPGNFPLNSEVQKVLEKHLRKRLIQHRWGLPRRILESLALMQPPAEFPEVSESKSTYGLSWIQDFKSRSSVDVMNGLRKRRSFYERSLESLRLEKDIRKDQVHNSENIFKDHMSKDRERSSVMDLELDSEKDPKSHRMSLSWNNSKASGVNLGQQQLENDSKIQIEGKIPEDSSWHAVEKTLPLTEISHTQMKHRNLAPLRDRDSYQNTSQEHPFIDPLTKQRLGDHVKCSHTRMKGGLPSKALDSIKTLKSTSSYCNLPASTTSISGTDSKIDFCEPPAEDCQMFSGDKITNSVPIIDGSLPAMSPVDMEGQGTLRHSPTDINHERTEGFRIIKDGRETPVRSLKHRNIDKTSQSKTLIPNRHTPELPTGQTGTGHKPKDNSTSSRDTAGISQGKGMVDRNLKHFPMASVSREILKAKDLSGLQSQSSSTVRTRELGNSQRKSVISNEVETKPMTKSPQLPTTSVSQNSDPSYLKPQLINELKFKLEARKNRQAQGSPTNRLPASDSLAPTDSQWNDLPTHAQSMPSGHMLDHHVLHVHVEDKGISMEQQQKPWVPKLTLGKCQDKNIPPAAKRGNLQGTKAEELAGGDAGLGTSQTRRKSHYAHYKAFKEDFGSKASQSLSQKGQCPPESDFRKKMNHFLQQLSGGIKWKRLDSSLEKDSSMPASMQSGAPERGRAVLTGTNQGQKLKTDGRCRKKLEHRHEIDTTCLQEPLCTHLNNGETQHKGKVKVQIGPVQGHPFNSRAPAYKTSTKACSQEAVSTGQSCLTNAGLIKDRNRQPQKMKIFKDVSSQEVYISSRRPQVPQPTYPTA